MEPRVVITGLGVVSPIGTGVDAFSRALRAGAVGINEFRPHNAPDDFSVQVAPIYDFELSEKDLPLHIQRSDRFSKLSVKAAIEAFEDAGLTADNIPQNEAACIVGCAVPGQYTIDRAYDALFVKKRKVHPLTLLQSLTTAPSSLISILFGLKGPVFSVSSACATATHSIGLCADLIRNRSCKIAVAGGAEACLTYGAMSAWKSMKIMSATKCRPFSKVRDGLSIGEGAGILILEELDHARARQAEIYAEVIGFSMTADADDMILPSLDGGIRVFEGVTNSFDIKNNVQKTYLNAHGTGTKANDVIETEIVKSVLKAQAYDLHISSTKSMHGHLLSAAGAIEAIATLCAMKGNFVPPTQNLDEPDDACDLNYTPNSSIEHELEYGISNSFGFGGINASLAFKKTIN